MTSTRDFVIGMFKANRQELTKIILVATLGALFAVVIPYIYGKVFDFAIIPESSGNLLLSLIGLWLILSLISNYISSKTGYLGEILGTKMSLDTEIESYSHFLTLPIAFHKKEQKGEVLHKISRGSWAIEGIVTDVSEILPQLLMLLFSLVAMFIIKWEIALVVLISFIVYVLGTIHLVKPEIVARRKERRAFEKQYGTVYDKLYNVFLVKNFAMEERESKAISKSLLGKALPPLKEAARRTRRVSVIQGFIHSISFVAVLSSAIWFLRKGDITSGQFVMFFGYTNLAFGPFRFFGGLYRRYKRSSVAIKRFLKLKEIAPEKMKHGDRIVADFKGNIDFEGVDFEYIKNKPILREVDLGIKAGESIALVGKSGVGKTTLAELLMGYYKPKKGTIRLDGIKIQNLQLNWLRNQIAVVPQDLNLFNDTLMNNIRYANPDATREEVIEASKAAFADDFIQDLPKKYDTIVGESGIKLSMGQRQRIAIAMAFLKNPKILILDEPTASLDSESEKKVQEGINKLISGKTTIIIAHRFSTVKNVDRIVVLSNGKIAETGKHSELMEKKGIYHNLYTLQKGFD
ncbi:MAG: ABC transporter ATP-binding protein [Nanoarchaeota archaeon]|nr:ABC transporter ATP-binding protein [Nanoarchaeota archaeon]